MIRVDLFLEELIKEVDSATLLLNSKQVIDKVNKNQQKRVN